MFKFADKQLDVCSDVGFKKLASIMKRSSLLSKFGDLDVLDPEDLKLLSDEDFALIYIDKEGNKIRRFPCPDVQNAIVSAAYYLDVEKELPEAASLIVRHNLLSAINNAMDSIRDNRSSKSTKEMLNKMNLEDFEKLRDALWDLKPHICGCVGESSKNGNNIYREPTEDPIEQDACVKAINKKMASEEAHRSQLSDDDFVFVTKKAGRTHRLFPISNADELRKQASYFDENHKSFHLEHRNQFAKKLRDKAKELGVKLDTRTISKYASYEWCPTAYECLVHRINQLKVADFIPNEKTAELDYDLVCDDTRAEALKGYLKLAEHIGEMDIDKYAHTLYMLDKASGLDKGYGRTIRDPYQSTYKQAAFNNPLMAPVNAVSTMFMGTPVSATDISKLDLSSLGGMIDQATFDELMADPIDVFNSLPIPYKSVIIEAIKNNS